MDRRRFLQLSAGGAILAAAVAQAPPARAHRTAAQSAGAAATQGVRPAGVTATLDAYARSGLEHTHGRVARVSGFIPPGLSLASNRDPLPADWVATRLTGGMTALLGPAPWMRLCGPDDVVAIKVNGLASGTFSPRPELVRAIAAGVRTAGVHAANVIIWDRTTREVERSGFPPQKGADDVRAYGTDALRGGGYGGDLEFSGSVGSLVSRIVSEYATVLINVGVLKDHDLAGVSAGMKSLYGAIHNPNRYHDNHCDPFVAEVAALPSIRRKLRLTVVDGILAQAEAGPGFAAQWVWPCDRLLLAVDPVACDRVAWDLLEARRARVGVPTLTEAGRPPGWIAAAAEIGIGRSEGLTLVDV
jgi:uncharacterized protein (DUF362 family)